MKKKFALLAAAAVIAACNTSNTDPGKDPGKDPIVDPVALAFDFTINEVTETTVNFTVTPNDAEANYLIMTVEKEYFDKFENNAAYIQDDLEYFKKWAEEEGKEMSALLTELTTCGQHTLLVGNLDPDTDYIVYAYGLLTDGNVISDLYGKEFKTLAEPGPEMIEMTFGLSALVNGTDVTLYTNPSRKDVMYLFDIFEPEDCVGDVDYAKLAKKQMQIYIDKYADGITYTAEDVVEGMCSKGSDRYLYEEMAPLTEYTAFACAFDIQGRVCSNVEVITFKTADVTPSDNIITITINEVGTTTVNASFRCTNDDKYLYQIEKASDFDCTDEDAYMKYWISYYGNYLDWVTDKGDVDYEFIDLDPDTDYVVFAYGIQSKVPTTALNKVLVHTLAQDSKSIKRLKKTASATHSGTFRRPSGVRYGY